MSLAKKITKEIEKDAQGTESRIRPEFSLVKLKENEVRNKQLYKISNHEELFRVGKSYLKDFNLKITSFAITSTGYKESQRRTILGIASYFDQVLEDAKILIVCDGLDSDTYKDLIQNSKNDDFALNDEIAVPIYNFNEKFFFINMDELVNLKVDSLSTRDFHKKLSILNESFDVVFWDVPELGRIQSDIDSYYPIMNQFHSLSIIIAKELTSKSELERLKTFFENYNINLKGALFHNVLEKTVKKWWEFWK